MEDAPFMLCGNRGVIDDGEHVTTPYRGNDWIYCVTKALRDPGEFMNGTSVTDLFFLDEPTALAAGHRPCHKCNGVRARQFDAAWASAKLGTGQLVAEIDQKLMEDRIATGKMKKSFLAQTDELLEGTIIRLESAPYLLAHGVIYPWTCQGYGIPRERPQGEVEVLTPLSTTLVMQQSAFNVSTENLIMRWETTP